MMFRSLRRLAAALAVSGASITCACAQATAAADCPPTPQQPSPEQIQAGIRHARDHGFLWRISKDGHDSYLFGTLHVGKLAWSFPGPHVLAALNATDTIALEIDALDPAMQQRLAQSMASQPHAALPAALQARLDRAAQAECVPPEALQSLAPEMEIATLTTLIGRRDGLDPGDGVDIFLAGWGHGRKRRVVSLETPEMQVALMQATSPEDLVESVDNALTELENGQARATLRQIAQVWADADWDRLSDYAHWCDCLNTESDRAEMARLLDERNPAMAEHIAALHASGARVFAAVGSLHMIGPGGLPALLAGRGYRVERITYEQKTETTP